MYTKNFHTNQMEKNFENRSTSAEVFLAVDQTSVQGVYFFWGTVYCT